MKFQIMGGKVCLKHKGKTLLGFVNKLFVFKCFLTTPNDRIESRLLLKSSKIVQKGHFPLHKLNRGWCIKFATGLNPKIGHSSKSIKVIKLSFCQNDPPMGESFWRKDSLITFILFELCLFWY